MLVRWSELGDELWGNSCPVLNDFKTLGWMVERVPSCSHGGPKTIGAYLIVHVATRRAYVGSHANLYSRPYQHHHLLKQNRHWIEEFQSCFDSDSRLVAFLIVTNDRETAYDVEQKILDKYYGTPWLFNSAQNARMAQLDFEVSQETREKLSLAGKGRQQTPEHVANRTRWMQGRKLSEETVEKIREKAKERGISPNLTAKAALVNSRAVWVDRIVYSSQVEAAKAHDIGQSSVRKRIASKSFPSWQNADDIFSRPIVVKGTRYDSIEAYSLLINRNPAIIKLRIDSDAEIYRDWRYVDEMSQGTTQ